MTRIFTLKRLMAVMVVALVSGCATAPFPATGTPASYWCVQGRGGNANCDVGFTESSR